MTTFTPTAEQTAILAAATTTTDNLLVSALAGAAKTSTLVLIAEALPKVEILCLAFNKKIAVEMQSRLPANCQAMTLNALGHRVWADATGRRLLLNSSKTYGILKTLIEELRKPEEKAAAYADMSDTIKIIDMGKACGYIPSASGYAKAKPLMDDSDFFNHLEEEPTPLQQELVRAATLVSLEQAFAGVIDFNDQILMPTVFHGAFPRFPLVLVDEAQDLSALNHAMLRKLVKKRVIAVGDECQAIYGFRGAHENSMHLLKEQFSMEELLLSISFRCPKAIIKHAQWRAPHMVWPDWAEEGAVNTPDSWKISDLPDDAVVICRNNAPLFELAIQMLKEGRYAELASNDIAKGLLKIMRKLGSHDLAQTSVMDAIGIWEAKKKQRAKKRAYKNIADKALCMRIFAEQGENLGSIIAYAEHILSVKSRTKLMTGHKSKGLEFDSVYFLDNRNIGREGQEQNLRYVIITRAKKTLTYIDLDNLTEG